MLVQRLFEGPIDIVGDVHGEIDALRDLLCILGYPEDGEHPEERRLVFVGDLVDRGPDSPAVVNLVQQLVDAARAQCVLGNHDFNVLAGDRKHDNHWFFGEPWSLDASPEPTPAVLADDAVRARTLAFFRRLPLALERPGMRVVHACWDDAMVDAVRESSDALECYNRFQTAIEQRLAASTLDEVDRGLVHQNENPVSVLTSGQERRIATPFTASGKVRYEERVRWWESYDGPLCVYGHYSRLLGQPGGGPRAICIDFGAAKRWEERKSPAFDGRFKGRLAALRIPENQVVFESPP